MNIALRGINNSQHNTIRPGPLIIQPWQPWLEANLLGATRALLENQAEMMILRFCVCQMCPPNMRFWEALFCSNLVVGGAKTC